MRAKRKIVLRGEAPETELKSLLTERRASILGRWFDAIIESYPANTSAFIKNQGDRFANPVGYAIHTGIEGILDELLNGGDLRGASSFLDDIIRVRAVQDFSASEAVAFIFDLKRVIRKELEGVDGDKGMSYALSALDSRIDGLACLSFDIYMGCREKLYELKVNEVRNMTFRLLKMANLTYEVEEPDVKRDNNNLGYQKEKR